MLLLFLLAMQLFAAAVLVALAVVLVATGSVQTVRLYKLLLSVIFTAVASATEAVFWWLLVAVGLVFCCSSLLLVFSLSVALGCCLFAILSSTYTRLLTS